MNHPEFTAKVRNMLYDGFGAEDIAIKLGVGANDVRNEVAILRQEGWTDRLRGSTRWGKTALRLMVCKVCDENLQNLQLSDDA